MIMVLMVMVMVMMWKMIVMILMIMIVLRMSRMLQKSGHAGGACMNRLPGRANQKSRDEIG